jgi:glycerol kinase
MNADSAAATSILVLDIGTSGLRAALVDHSGTIVDYEHVANPPATPLPGLVEFDPNEMYAKSLAVLAQVVERNAHVRVAALGITNQRASTIAWNKRTGEPCGPGIGWQDLRTVMECITAKSEHDIHLAPNQTATKASWLLKNAAAHLDAADVCIGTIDSWITWKLTDGAVFVTDHTNAAVTGLVDVHTVDWDPSVCETLDVPVSCLPRVVASSEVVGRIATDGPLRGIVIASRIGDQQSSLVGQGCIAPGDTKITFGTGGMLDMVTGEGGPSEPRRTPHGTFPIVAFSLSGDHPTIRWGIEAVMLSAGTNVEWLCEDMMLIDSPDRSGEIAASVSSTEGVIFVPALLGLGTPDWDYGARGTLTGLTRGTTSAHVVRAVLDGIAHRGADLFEAALADLASRGVARPSRLRLDGGMSRNSSFTAMLADAVGTPVHVSAVTEATTLGAAYLAGVATGVWPTLDDAAATWRSSAAVEPSLDETERAARRTLWRENLAAARAWIPALSALDF